MTASPTRQGKLYQQLRLALANTKAEDLKMWGRASAARLPRIAGRRVKNLGRLLSSVARFTGKEISGALAAWRNGRFGQYLENRAAAGIDGSIHLGRRTWKTVETFGRAPIDDPRKNASGVLALALGFLAGSGGIDGNGGVPDTDITYLGIAAHRSIFTHSIIAGTVVEGAILALADLAQVVCDKLPASGRDPFWDKLVEGKNNITLQLAKGASAGIAYHLAVDATLQPGAYHGLPGHVPEEAHQTLFALNAAAEGIDVAHKGETTGEKVISGAKTAGGAVVKGAAVGAGAIWGLGKGFIAGLKGDKN